MGGGLITCLATTRINTLLLLRWLHAPSLILFPTPAATQAGVLFLQHRIACVQKYMMLSFP